MRTAAALLVACLALGCGGDDGPTFDAEGVERWAIEQGHPDPAGLVETVRATCLEPDPEVFRGISNNVALESPGMVGALTAGCVDRVFGN